MASKLLRRIGAAAAVPAVLAGAMLVSGPARLGEVVAGAHTDQQATVRLVAGSENLPKMIGGQTPIFRRGMSRMDYFGFLNRVRQIIASEDSRLPRGASNLGRIDHTDNDSGARNRFFEVAVEDIHGRAVRIRFNAANLYLVGWFTSQDTYNYIAGGYDEGGVDGNRRWTPSDRSGRRGGSWQLARDGQYGTLEGIAGPAGHRDRITYNADNTARAALALYQADHRETMAQAVVYFAQFVAEAARIRPIADRIGWEGFGGNAAENARRGTRLPRELISVENQWGSLSARANTMLRDHQLEEPANRQPLRTFYRQPDGQITGITLRTLALYALVLNTALGMSHRK